MVARALGEQILLIWSFTRSAVLDWSCTFFSFHGDSLMRTQLTVATGPCGLPSAEVPFTCMWDLVEYLSYQRVAVSYQYEASHFTVTFPKQDVDSAQRILNEWSRSTVGELQPA